LTGLRCLLLVILPVMTSSLFLAVRVAGAVLASGALSGRAQLAASSPFLVPQAAATAGATAGAPLEYGGFLDVPGGERLYRIKDPARKTSEWVKLNQRNPTLEVTARQYDDSQKTLIVEYQGRTLTLAERESKILSAGAVPQPVPAGVSFMPAAVTQSVVTNPSPADDQRRLEAVAAEVARRRALREQASQQVNPNGVPQIAPPAPGNFPATPQGDNQQANPRRNQGGIRGQGTRQQR
jgi:hypothetical protein